MRAADLRERVTFASPTAIADDGYGNVTGGWTEEFSTWASLMPLKGGEDVMAARLSGRQPAIIRVRHSSDSVRIAPSWRATWRGDVYNIRSAADMDGRRMYIDILAESGVAV